MKFYISSTGNYRAWLNGGEVRKDKTNNSYRIKDNIVTLPVVKGKNELLLKTYNHSGEWKLICEPVDVANLIDEVMADKKIIKHIAYDIPIKFNTKYSDKYNGGINALTDGYRGSENYWDKFWVGFEKVDLDAELDLEEETTINNISLGFLEDVNAWIFPPKRIEIALSKDGQDYESFVIIEENFPENNDEKDIHNYSKEFNNKLARYIKIKAENIGQCPQWHAGAGGKAWIFIDEIAVD
jgi:hypothetical protein